MHYNFQVYEYEWTAFAHCALMSIIAGIDSQLDSAAGAAVRSDSAEAELYSALYSGVCRWCVGGVLYSV